MSDPERVIAWNPIVREAVDELGSRGVSGKEWIDTFERHVRAEDKP